MLSGSENHAKFNTQLFDERIPREGEEGNQKVTFTPEQQARVDEIVRESMGRAAKDLRAEKDQLATKTAELEAKLADALSKVNSGTKKEKKDAADDAEALKAQLDETKRVGEAKDAELERMRRQMADKDKEVNAAKERELETRKRVAIQGAANTAGFIDVDIVLASTSSSVAFDAETGKFVVKGENGQVRQNSSYEPMTLDEFYKEYAANKPYLVRGDVKSGTGSSEASRSTMVGKTRYAVDEIFGPKSDPVKANKLALSDPKEYKRMKSAARDMGLIRF